MAATQVVKMSVTNNSNSSFQDLLTGGWVDELAFLAVWLPSLSRVVLKKSDSENVRSSSPDSADLADFWPFCLDEFGVVAKRFLPFLATDLALMDASKLKASEKYDRRYSPGHSGWKSCN